MPSSIKKHLEMIATVSEILKKRETAREQDAMMADCHPSELVVGRPTGPVRCAYCHGGDSSGLYACEGCGTKIHLACLFDHGDCPTLGCDAIGKGAQPAPAKADWPEPELPPMGKSPTDEFGAVTMPGAKRIPARRRGTTFHSDYSWVHVCTRCGVHAVLHAGSESWCPVNADKLLRRTSFLLEDEKTARVLARQQWWERFGYKSLSALVVFLVASGCLAEWLALAGP